MLSKEDVRHIAKLARLHIEDDQIGEYQEQLSSILDYVAQLQTLDTENIPELQHVAELANVLREDVEQGCEQDVRRRALDNFANRKEDLLEVQAVFENRSV